MKSCVSWNDKSIHTSMVNRGYLNQSHPCSLQSVQKLPDLIMYSLGSCLLCTLYTIWNDNSQIHLAFVKTTFIGCYQGILTNYDSKHMICMREKVLLDTLDLLVLHHKKIYRGYLFHPSLQTRLPRLANQNLPKCVIWMQKYSGESSFITPQSVRVKMYGKNR